MDFRQPLHGQEKEGMSGEGKKREKKEELEFDSKQASWKIPLLACPYAHTCR